MEAEDIIKLSSSSHSGSECESGELRDSENPAQARETGELSGNSRPENGELCDSGNSVPARESGEVLSGNCGSESGELRDISHFKPHEVESQASNHGMKDDKIDEEKVDPVESDCGIAEKQVVETERCHGSADELPVHLLNVEAIETVAVVDNAEGFNSDMEVSDDEAVQNKSPIQNIMMDGTPISSVNNARMANDDRKTKVHVIYSSLTRASKKKLEEVLQEWSKWDAKHGFSLDEKEVIESGEETYYPALQVGTEKTTAVSFWIDSQTSNECDKEFTPVDGRTVPLYDRGFAFGLTSEDGSSNKEGGLRIVRDVSRCFNCGSYDHALKDCPKPRDNAAVNKARKEHNMKKNQSGGSGSHINPTRYYQNSRGGKFDDLKPGSLTAETRQLLGLGEFDPPPWLNRMREIGYPPGYLAADEEDQPSGITIFADDIIEEDHEDGEIPEAKYDPFEIDPPAKRRKKTIEFPGINAPIPTEANKKRWARPASPNSDPPRSKSPQRSDIYSDRASRGYHHERRFREYPDYPDEGPPGVDPVFSLPSSYPPRYGRYMERSPTLTRSESDRGWRSPLSSDDYISRDYYDLPHSSYDRHPYPSDPWRYDDRHRHGRW